MNCAEETDLTELGVGIGHVFDCDGCGFQLRVTLFGEVVVGIREDELRGREASSGTATVDKHGPNVERLQVNVP
jgi:hypothetical protein